MLHGIDVDDAMSLEKAIENAGNMLVKYECTCTDDEYITIEVLKKHAEETEKQRIYRKGYDKKYNQTEKRKNYQKEYYRNVTKIKRAK